MAGFGAACAAGRAGLKTLLVERQAQLGGMGTAGGVGNFCYGFGAPIGNGRVFDDVIEAMSSAGAIGEEAGWQVQRSAPLQRENHTNYHAILPLVLQRLARDAGVELLFCTDVVGTVTDSRRITEVVLHNRSLLHAVRAPLFVDATRRHSGPACRCANPAGGRPGAAADDQAEPDDIPAPGRRGAASAATTCSASTMSAPGASSATASRRLLHHRRPQLR